MTTRLMEGWIGNRRRYPLGTDGLNMVLCDHFCEEIEDLFEETDFQEEPRRLDQIRPRARVEATYNKPGELGPYTDFEIGMLNGKMSALRLGARQRMGLSRHLIRRP